MQLLRPQASAPRGYWTRTIAGAAPRPSYPDLADAVAAGEGDVAGGDEADGDGEGVAGLAVADAWAVFCGGAGAALAAAAIVAVAGLARCGL